MAPGVVTSGGIESVMVTLKLACALLLRVSEALHVTVVVPAGKLLPDVRPVALTHITGRAPSTWSSAVGSVKLTTGLLLCVMSLGTFERLGANVSWTITLK